MRGVEKLKKLSSIRMEKCENLKDVSGIEKLPKLNYFYCDSDKIEDITPLTKLQDENIVLCLKNDVVKKVIRKVPSLESRISVIE